MAFPLIETTAETAVSTAGTSHVINLPSGIVRGNGIVIICDKGSTAATFNSLAGWNDLIDVNAGNGITVWYREADGTEGSTVTFTSSGSTRSASIAFRISAKQDFNVRAPEISTVATGTSTGPDASTCTPTGGAKDYLWITFAGMAGEEADDDTWGNTSPTNYSPGTPLQIACGTVGTNLGGLILAASRTLNASSEDAGAFNVDVSAAWNAYTIAIHPQPQDIAATSASYQQTTTPTPERIMAPPKRVLRGYPVDQPYFAAASTSGTNVVIDEPAPFPVTLPPVTVVLSPAPYIPLRASAAAIAMEPQRSAVPGPKPILRPTWDTAFFGMPIAAVTAEVAAPPARRLIPFRRSENADTYIAPPASATYPAGLDSASPPSFRSRAWKTPEPDSFIPTTTPAVYPSGLSVPQVPNFTRRVMRAPEPDSVIPAAPAASAVFADDVSFVPVPGPISTIVISKDVYIAPAAPAVYPAGLTTPHAPWVRPRWIRVPDQHTHIAPVAAAAFVFADATPIVPQFLRRPTILRPDRSGTFGVAFAIVEYNSGWDAPMPPVARRNPQANPFRIPEFIPITPPSFKSWLEPVIPARPRPGLWAPPFNSDSPILAATTPPVFVDWGGVLARFSNRPKEPLGNRLPAQDVPLVVVAPSFINWTDMGRPPSPSRRGLIVPSPAEIVIAATPAFSFWTDPVSPATVRRAFRVPAVDMPIPAVNIAAAIDWAASATNPLVAQRVIRRIIRAEEIGVVPRINPTPDYGWTMLTRLPVRPKPSMAPFLPPEYLRFQNYQFITNPDIDLTLRIWRTVRLDANLSRTLRFIKDITP